MHIPVLLRETIELLNLHPNDNVIDGTVGLGGHAKAVLEKISPNGQLLALDRDPRQLVLAKNNLKDFGKRIIFVNDSYANLVTHTYAQGFTSINAVLLDLGFSSVHVDDPLRGFSFQTEGPLDMRYDPTASLTAAEIINTWSADDLKKIFRLYGEENATPRIVQRILNHRKKQLINTTTQLAEIILEVVPRRGKIHPATRVFQALRIAVNDELGEIERALPKIIETLTVGGRLAVISFHSLEDRIIKQFFKHANNKTLKILNKHVIVPTPEEILKNPRARSAKLRGVEKI